MVDQRKISISVPSYNRVDFTIQSFEDVYEDERINEIVVVDDESDWGIFTELKEKLEHYPKVKLFRNKSNRDCYVNKATALSYSNNDYAILLDSDNKIDKTYLDKIYSIDIWERDVIYTPELAFPNFDFRAFAGLEITKYNVSEYMAEPMFETMLNAANYFMNRNEYLDIWDETIDPVTSDSIYMVSRWLEAGNRIKVVGGLQYFHRVHSGSHYQNNKHRTPDGFHEEILYKLKTMC